MTFEISKIRIPSDPGIYLMKDSEQKIIYIGKAKNLKNRVKSYFLKNQNYKTQKLVENMYTYLRISDEKYPRLLVARRTRDGKFLGKGKIFGPFTKGSSKLLTIGTLRKAFQIRICTQLPKKVCLEYHLGNCEGPCEFKEAQEQYPKHVSALEEVLKGKNQTNIFTQKLKEEMKQAADLQQFERAKEIRDTLIRLDSLQTKQKMEYVDNSDEEYFGIGEQNQTVTAATNSFLTLWVIILFQISFFNTILRIKSPNLSWLVSFLMIKIS
jgi:excinuclease ABC subunit C